MITDYNEIARDGRIIRIASCDDHDEQLKVLFKVVMPVAIETYRKKVLELGEAKTFTDARMAHVDGYCNGFYDAVYFMVKGLLSVTLVEPEETEDELVQQG